MFKPGLLANKKKHWTMFKPGSSACRGQGTFHPCIFLSQPPARLESWLQWRKKCFNWFDFNDGIPGSGSTNQRYCSCTYFLCQYHFPSTRSWIVPQEPCWKLYQLEKWLRPCWIRMVSCPECLFLSLSPVQSVGGHALPTDGNSRIFKRRDGKSSRLSNIDSILTNLYILSWKFITLVFFHYCQYPPLRWWWWDHPARHYIIKGKLFSSF